LAFPADTYSEAVDLSITASNQLHTILNGDSTTEVTVEDGSKIPSVRKAYTDSLFFLSPQPWSVGEYETAYNQLRSFAEPSGITTWWFSKTATISTPILMSTTPHEDTNWTLWNAINNSVYETQKRLAAEAGLNMVGSFLLGATVTTTDDVVFYETDGKYYKWGGSLPKTILAGTTPSLSGGLGTTAWIDSTSYLLKYVVDYNKIKAETDSQSGILSFATDTGVANTYVCNFTPAITARSEGQVLRFKVANTNTGASTINDGVNAVPLVGGAHSALQGGELVSGGDAWVQWNSTVGTGSYVLLFCAGASMQISDASKSHHAVSKGQLDAAVGPATDTTAGIARRATDSEEIAGTSDVGFLTPLGLRNAINAAGSAPIFAARAWACFKQVGTQTIKASGNILSITDVAVGRTTLTFATAMIDTNYAVAGAPTTQAGSTIGPYSTTPTTAESTLKLTGSCQLGCWDNTGSLVDFYDTSVIFTR